VIRLGGIVAALAVAACGRERSAWPPPPPDRATELAALQGRWWRGDRGCRIEVDGASLRESCPRAEDLLYGDRWYVISFPQPGLIRLSEGGSYHEYGYARRGEEIYLGNGGAGVWVGDSLVAAPFRFHALLILSDGGCRQHRWISDPPAARHQFHSPGVVIDCERDDRNRVTFHVLVQPQTGASWPVTFERVGDAAITSPLSRLERDVSPQR
jgi:hypothetical protein